MTPGVLVESLRRRGIRLEADGGRLHYVGPVTPAELVQLRQHKAEVLRLLTGEGTKPAAGEAPVPTGPCELCGALLAYVEGWPTAGEARWLCPACSRWPALSLAEVFRTLTREERERLRAEAAMGERLAVEVSKQLAATGTEVAGEERGDG